MSISKFMINYIRLIKPVMGHPIAIGFEFATDAREKKIELIP
jgi:hypothetical protein